MNFIEKYNHKKNIVETGTSRGKNKFFFFKKFNWKDGMSTLMFSEFADFIQGELHTCDISKKILKMQYILQKNLRKTLIFM